MFKRIVTIFIIFLLSFNFFNVNAENNEYSVFDINNGLLQTFIKYSDAENYYLDNLDKYDNLYITYNEKVLQMEYGVVIFPDEINKYYSLTKKDNDYISGLYGQDGAYIKSDEDYVYFYISSDYGRIDVNLVELLPINKNHLNISKYICKNQYLYHLINNDLNNNYYQDVLLLDKANDYFENNEEYYSYDGHYFYDDFYKMIDDYRNNNHHNSINETPYYNYYQYLPHRSISNYNSQDIKKYIEDILSINARLDNYLDLNFDEANDIVNKSQLYNMQDCFINNQYIYGSNAMMLLSSAIVESNYGKSEYSYLNNSFYLNNAYDNYIDRTNNHYSLIENSIKNRSKYLISNIYSNHLLNTYNGTFFGNKISGINVEYSLDQYYGERCASKYFEIDNSLGLKDYNNYSIGLVCDKDELNIYKDEELDNKLYTLRNINELSFVVLQDLDGIYKIQIDDSFINSYTYNYLENVAYIDADDIDFILNKEKIKENEYVEVQYDFNEGSYDFLNKIDLYILKDSNVNIKPYKDGYEFINYDENNIAQYKKIEDIEIEGSLNNYPDISNTFIKVKYDDKTTSLHPLTSDNLSYIDINNYDEQDLDVSYNGVVKNYKINIKEKDIDNINSFIEAKDNKNYDYLIKNLNNNRSLVTMDVLRDINNNLDKSNRNYVITNINNNNVDIGLSGLDYGLKDLDDFVYINDTYYVKVNNCNPESYKVLGKFGLNYDFEIENNFNIDFGFNYQDIDLNSPVIVSIKLNEPKENNIYTVYHLKENVDIVKCLSTRSNNYCSFILDEEGDYIIFSKEGLNIYNIEDIEESLTYKTMGFDNHRINISFMVIIALLLLGFIGITIYYIYNYKRIRLWKDYKKSLLKVDTVQEEKQNN